MEITAKLWNFELCLADRKRHNHFPSCYYSFRVKNLSCVNSWLLFLEESEKLLLLMVIIRLKSTLCLKSNMVRRWHD